MWTVTTGASSPQILRDELVAAKAPAFINFDEAATAFFGRPSSPNRSFAGREIIVREQDQRARIESVRVRPNYVVATVGGEELGGAYLALGGETGQSTRLRRGTREVTLPLVSDLATGAWLALHRDHELLDRRILDPSWPHSDIEVEADGSTRVEVLISRGEGASTEFKRQLPGSDPRGAMKTVAAFANGSGGSLLFGVDDDGRAIGLTDASTRAAADRLATLISHGVRPRIDFTLEPVDVSGAHVLLVDVRPGGDPPYGVGTTDRETVYDVRRGATSFPASSADVRAFVRARMMVTADPQYRLLGR